MTDYISREAVIAETRKPRLTDAELRRRLAELPAADVAPVRHGRLDEKSTDMGMYFQCSACGCAVWNVKPFLFGNGDYNYCPNCGAKMDGDGNA